MWTPRLLAGLPAAMPCMLRLPLLQSAAGCSSIFQQTKRHEAGLRSPAGCGRSWLLQRSRWAREQTGLGPTNVPRTGCNNDLAARPCTTLHPSGREQAAGARRRLAQAGSCDVAPAPQMEGGTAAEPSGALTNGGPASTARPSAPAFEPSAEMMVPAAEAAVPRPAPGLPSSLFPPAPTPERFPSAPGGAPAPERFPSPPSGAPAAELPELPAPSVERFPGIPTAPAAPAAEGVIQPPAGVDREDLPQIVSPNATQPTEPVEIPVYVAPPSPNPVVASGQDIIGARV